jgi:hypothetical protein
MVNFGNLSASSLITTLNPQKLPTKMSGKWTLIAGEIFIFYAGSQLIVI